MSGSARDPNLDFFTLSHDTVPNFAKPSKVTKRVRNDADLTGIGPDDVVVVEGSVTVKTLLECRVFSLSPGATVKFALGGKLRYRYAVQVLEGAKMALAAGAKASILYTGDGAFEPGDTFQFGNGFLVYGTFTAETNQSRKPFVRLAGPVPAGSLSLRLEAPADGWKAGDRIGILTGEDYNAWAYSDGAVPAAEERTIASISADGITVSLDRPLDHDHLGAWVYASGQWSRAANTYLPHVVNLTREHKVGSLDPTKRAHFMAFAHATVDVKGVRFTDMGRTESDQSVGFVGGFSGQIGRYLVHNHHCHGGVLIYDGCVFEGAKRWSMAIHDTAGVKVFNNVFWGADGANLVFEQGNEHSCEVNGNLFACLRKGFGLNGDTWQFNASGDCGSAVWGLTCFNKVWGNVLAASQEGFGITAVGEFGQSLVHQVPPAPGQPTTEVVLNLAPSVWLDEIKDNEVYACERALRGWNGLGNRMNTLTAWNTDYLATLFYTGEWTVNGFKGQGLVSLIKYVPPMAPFIILNLDAKAVWGASEVDDQGRLWGGAMEKDIARTFPNLQYWAPYSGLNYAARKMEFPSERTPGGWFVIDDVPAPYPPVA